MNTLKRKLNKRFKDNLQLRQDYLRRRLNWTEENGKEEMLILLFTKVADSLNPRKWSSVRRTNWLIRFEGKNSLFGELNVRNRACQEDRAKDYQEIEDIRRICCAEADRARQLRIDEHSMQQTENPSTVNQLLAQIQDLQNKVNSLSDARDFDDPETASSSGASHVPSQPLNIPSPKGMLSRDSGLSLDTRNSMGTSGNVLEHLPAQEGPSCALFEDSKNLASSSCGLGSSNTGNIMEHGRKVRRDPQSSSIQTPRFNQGIDPLNPLYHTQSRNHLGKFPDPLEFQSWKVNCKTEVCANSIFLQITVPWIKEV